jgi:para-aminobenzoate synthetase / 4-amino-4-deoxychorismate lyase
VETKCVRFDDLSPGGYGSFGLTGEVDVFTARRPEDVIPVIEAAQAAAQAGCWVAGFVSYEAAAGLNPDLPVRPPGLHDPMRDLPLARFEAFSTKIDLADIATAYYPPRAYNVSGWSPDSTRRDYRDSLAVTGRAIMSGEIKRGKHTFRLHAAFSGDQVALYRDLLQSQRGPHGACIETGRFGLVSVSPERFFKISDGVLTVRPVLASVRRGRWVEEDSTYAARLSIDRDLDYENRILLAEAELELAELGELLPPADSPIISLDRLELTWHLTAQIGVHIRPDVSLTRIFKVLFPPLAVTGVPKPAAMGVIATTEDTPRGAYCGAIGFLAPDGTRGTEASFSVAVRTVVIDNEEGVAEYGVGTAIARVPDVKSAYEEARLKARVLVDRRPDFQLLERFRDDDGEIAGLETKIRILEDSARYFGFNLNTDDAIAALGKAELNGHSNEIELRVSRDGALETIVRRIPGWSGSVGDAPVISGCVASERVSVDNVFLFHKTTDPRLRGALARQNPDAEVVILINDEGNVAGSLEGNVFVETEGRWRTPPRRCGSPVYAVCRELVATGAAEEQVLSAEDLWLAERVAVVNDTSGWRMVELTG